MNVSMIKANLVRDGEVLLANVDGVHKLHSTHPSKNKAKRESRALQKQGKSVRRIDSVGD